MGMNVAYTATLRGETKKVCNYKKRPGGYHFKLETQVRIIFEGFTLGPV